jgi:uncharacterized membrane protein YccC
VLEGFDVDHTLRVIAYLSIALGSNAIITAGGHPEEQVSLPVSTPRLGGVTGVLVRATRTIRSHLDPTSTILQSSVRTAAALGIAVLLANRLGLQHGFWVVLGTLQVLRSNALGTGRTSVQAILGNLAGVIIGGLFAVVGGNNHVLFWVVLPAVVFIAAYSTTAVGFAASQAAFSVLLIILFNLIAPAGWQIGIVRIEDLLVGAGISIVVGILIWPRGVRRSLATSMARFYRAVGAYLDQAYDRILGLKPPHGMREARRAAIRAADRAGEAFDAFVLEKAAGPLSADMAGLLLSSGNHAILAGDLLDALAGMGYQATSCADGARSVEGQVLVLLEGLSQLADRLALSKRADRAARVSIERLRTAALDCLRRWRNDEAIGRGAIAVVMAAEWTQNLARLQNDIEPAVNAAVETARLPWWR